MSIVDATDPTKPLTSDKVKQLVDEIKALKTRINAVVADLGLNYLATEDDSLVLPTITGHALGTLTATTTGLAWTQPNSFALPAIVSSAVLTSNAAGTALEWKTFPAVGSTVPGNLAVVGSLTVGSTINSAGGITTSAGIACAGNITPQQGVDFTGGFYINKQLGTNNPVFNFEANSYFIYDNATNALSFSIQGYAAGYLDSIAGFARTQDLNPATQGNGLPRLSQVISLTAKTNLLINSNFAVNQRAYVSGASTVTANQVTLDRWRVVTSGQNLTYAALGAGNEVTAPAAGIEQIIEAGDIQGGTYVLNWSGTAGGFVNGTVIAKGGTIVLPANTVVTVKFWQGTVSTAKLELSPVSTAYEIPQVSVELHKCQRDYEAGTSSIGGYGNAANLNFVPVPFKATKRVVPTLTYAAISVANCSVFDVRSPDLTHFVLACQPAVTGGYIWDCAWTAATGF